MEFRFKTQKATLVKVWLFDYGSHIDMNSISVENQWVPMLWESETLRYSDLKTESQMCKVFSFLCMVSFEVFSFIV